MSSTTLASPTARYVALTLESLGPVSRIAQPTASTPSLGLDSPARALLTDFQVTRAHCIAASSPTTRALEAMKQAGVRLLMVVDAQERFTGVITARELIGGRLVTLAMQRRQIDREDVTVEMVQTPHDQLHALPLAKLERARIGDLVETLRSSGDQHLLVTEPDADGQPRIRGLISTTDISQALGIKLDRPPEARTFASICQVILGHAG
ncbi:CBS domain-containing protein [Halomonas sp. McH1-25]|uniref:CBS domain-containing protein n=1 Tax=unclassified Halomonas TaxID=2609666 RepID=UPI001EF5F65E|nr:MULTISPECIES: CBS domain-containing protein [unclassified Halomonas]MCG7600743.1 CBS domain-containing protein [Halomonas sp. McH1-25]MCP1341321.1 CBS domain-containing protein [Halomonas sp. FL8]MCP1363049.1 CBS domain-containing protein [Halomonas sp. BBD45]